MKVGEYKMLSIELSPCDKMEPTAANAAQGDTAFQKSPRRRWFLIVLLVLCWLPVLLSGCADDKTTAVTTTTTTTTVPSATIVITGSESDFKSAKKPVLIVHYEFTNNTAAPVSFAYLCKDRAYQDGLECDVDTADLLYSNVKPGETQKLSIAYILKNKTSVVDIEIKEWLSDEVLLRQILTPDAE